MSGTPLTTWPHADVAEVAQTMLDHEVRSMPVVEDGEVVGMVSRRDILRTVIRTDDVIGQEVQHRLDEYAGEAHRWTAKVADGVVTIEGAFDDQTERAVITVIARTVPGVADVV
jgi:predicted transcriptional regulator